MVSNPARGVPRSDSIGLGLSYDGDEEAIYTVEPNNVLHAEQGWAL